MLDDLSASQFSITICVAIRYLQDVVVVGWIGLVGGLVSAWVNLIWVVVSHLHAPRAGLLWSLCMYVQAIAYAAWLVLGPKGKKA